MQISLSSPTRPVVPAAQISSGGGGISSRAITGCICAAGSASGGAAVVENGPEDTHFFYLRREADLEAPWPQVAAPGLFWSFATPRQWMLLRRRAGLSLPARTAFVGGRIEDLGADSAAEDEEESVIYLLKLRG